MPFHRQCRLPAGTGDGGANALTITRTTHWGPVTPLPPNRHANLAGERNLN